MRSLWAFSLIVFLALAAARPASAAPEDLTVLLHHRKPEVRAAAARLLAETKDPAVLEQLLDAFRDETDEKVRLAMAEDLHYMTQKNVGTEYTAWRTWYENEGRHLFPAQPAGNRGTSRGSDLPDALRSTESWVLILAQVAVVAITVAIFGMFVVAGYRLRKMNDITRRADEFVSAAADARKHFENLQREMEAKKDEALKYFARLKEDNEAEIERFSDDLGRNVEHRMREVTMTLREKAEKELEHTLREVKEETLEQIRALSQGERERILGELRTWEASFKSRVASGPPVA